MVAATDHVVVQAARGRNEAEALVAIMIATGDIAWTYGEGVMGGMAAAESTIYVGTIGVASVHAIDSYTGNLEWSEPIPGGQSVSNLVALSGTLSAFTNDGVFASLRAADGQLIKTMDSVNTVFVADPQLVLVQQPRLNSLSRLDPESGGVVWETSFEDEVTEEPVLSGDMAFVRTGVLVGRVYAVSLDTGEPVWATDRNVISNAALVDGIVFYLTDEAELLGISSASGQPVVSASFSPSNLTLNTSNSPVGAYLVAGSQKRVFVLLGDSDQLFGFKFSGQPTSAQHGGSWGRLMQRSPGTASSTD